MIWVLIGFTWGLAFQYHFSHHRLICSISRFWALTMFCASFFISGFSLFSLAKVAMSMADW